MKYNSHFFYTPQDPPPSIYRGAFALKVCPQPDITYLVPMTHFLLQSKHVAVVALPKKLGLCDHACPSPHRGPESRSRQLLVSSRSLANLHYPRNSAKTSRVLSLVQWAWWVLDQQKTSQNKRYDSNTKAQLPFLLSRARRVKVNK